MATKQLFPQDAGDIIHDLPDIIFRQNCANYFDAQKKINASTTAVIREFHPTPSQKTSEPIHDNVGEKPKLQVSPVSALKLKDVNPEIRHDHNVEDTKEEVLNPEELPVAQKLEISPTEIVMAVDATPTRVGGLLRLPGNERTIFYYSTSWTTHFEFDDSTKFEMVNAALALELFKPYLNAYRERYDKLIVKTDNNFYGSIKGFKDPLDVNFLIGIRSKVKCLRGEFQHVIVSQKDADIQNADYLSRTELPIGMKIEYGESSSFEKKAVRYVLVDLSAVARGHTLDVIKEYVRGKYMNERTSI